MATRRLSELDRFLSAPALPPRALGRAGGGWTNYDIVVAVCGVRGIHVRDRALFDAVSMKYERDVDTFAQAFAVCLRGRRSIANMDIACLRECHPAFEALQLPETISDAKLVADLGDWFKRQAGEAEPEEEAPPAPEEPRAPAQARAAAPPPRAPERPRTVADIQADLARLRGELAAAAREEQRVKYMRDLHKYLRRNLRQKARRVSMTAAMEGSCDRG